MTETAPARRSPLLPFAAGIVITLLVIGAFWLGRSGADDTDERPSPTAGSTTSAATTETTETPEDTTGTISSEMYDSVQLRDTYDSVIAKLGPPIESPGPEITQGNESGDGAECIYYQPRADLPQNTAFQFCFRDGIVISAFAY